MEFVVRACLVLACVLSVGCASVTQGSTHALRIDTETDKGEVIAGAPCDLATEIGTFRVTSGQGTQVKRSGRDLEITCTSPGLPPASGKLISRANAGMAGNILIGGGIGALIDHNSGSAYTYPTWVKLVFGEYAVFDRKEEKEGVAMVAKPGTATKTVAVATVATPDAGGTVVKRDAPQRAPGRAAFEVGDTFDYVRIDHLTATRQNIVYRVDRVAGDAVHFNSGAQIVRANGDLVESASPIALELDVLTPPGGWTRDGKPLAGSSSYKFSKQVGGNSYAFDVTAMVGAVEMVSLPVGPVHANRIEVKGWNVRVSSGLTGSPTAAPYNATVWYSPELLRIVKFKVATRYGSGGAASYVVDESLELAYVKRD